MRRSPSTLGLLLPVELMPHRAGAPRRRPVHTPIPAPRAPSLPPVAMFTQAPLALRDDVTADQVRQALADHPQSGSVVLLDGQRRPVGFLDRNRFMLAISGPFGHALYAHRPAARSPTRRAPSPRSVDVRTALAHCLAGDRTRSYDDLVLLDEHGACAGIVRVGDLLAEATGVHAAA